MALTENTAVSDSTISTALKTSFWQPLSHPAFAALWIAAFFSDVGVWIHGVGATWMITTMNGSPFLISMVLTITGLPVFLLGIPAGALSDIFNRRKILLFTQAWMTVFATILAVTTYMGIYSPWLILIFCFFLAIGPALNDTVWQSIVHYLVPPEHLHSAIVLNGVSINLARAIGPALAGVLLSYSTPFVVFSFNAACFLVTFIIVFSWKGTGTSTIAQTQRFIAAMRSGVKYVMYATQIRPVLIRAFIFTFGVSALWGLLSYVIVQKLNLNATAYGTSLFMIGAGAISAALLLPFINDRVSINQKLSGSILIIALSIGCLAYSTNIVLLYLLFFCTGVAWLTTMSSFNVSLQTNIPRWVQSRVISIYLLVFQTGLAIGSFAWGLIAENFGLNYALLGAAAFMIASIVLVFPYSLNVTKKPDWTPYNHWPEPFLNIEVAPEEGPVLVLIDYTVTQENIQKFTVAFENLKKIRLRDGVLQVGIFQNVTSPQMITEFLLIESWEEYLLHVQRFTNEDKSAVELVMSFHSGEKPPEVRQMVSQKNS